VTAGVVLVLLVTPARVLAGRVSVLAVDRVGAVAAAVRMGFERFVDEVVAVALCCAVLDIRSAP